MSPLLRRNESEALIGRETECAEGLGWIRQKLLADAREGDRRSARNVGPTWGQYRPKTK